MKPSISLTKVRAELEAKRKSELVISNSDYHQELIKELTDITNKMNEEKISAIKSIEEKYKDRILELQDEYSLYLKLNS